MAANFAGFQDNKKDFTGIPDQFFRELLQSIQDINEMKLVLYLLWSAYTQGDFSLAFSPKEILLDNHFIQGLGASEKGSELLVTDLLNKLARDNVIIRVEENRNGNSSYYINSPRGRAAAELMQPGSLLKSNYQPKATLNSIKPNIFKLYEDNIGPLTPIIADTLKDALDTYPLEWIEEAIEIAVANNVRRWNYIKRILSRWQEEGRDGTDRRNTQEDHRRYLKGEYGEFGRH
jgi:DnaD/phage-associated family protein